MTARPLLAVLDYGIGNLRSAEKSLQRVGADARLTSDPALIGDAAGLVLPGVGSFGRCMEALRATGLDRVAAEAIAQDRPFLGICVGMQLLYRGSDESPGCTGLGVVEASIRRLPAGVRCPQMQWNEVHVSEPHPMFEGIDGVPWMYFVHSFAAEPTAEVIATCDYGGPIVAAVARGSLWATQFHPEKSGPDGLAMLANFVRTVAA